MGRELLDALKRPNATPKPAALSSQARAVPSPPAKTSRPANPKASPSSAPSSATATTPSSSASATWTSPSSAPSTAWRRARAARSPWPATSASPPRRPRFIEAFVRVGLVPDSGSSFFLPRLVGLAKALEMAFLGDEVNAEEASASAWSIASSPPKTSNRPPATSPSASPKAPPKPSA